MNTIHFQRLCAALAFVLAVSILLSTVPRSVWMDEAMLLKNLIEIQDLAALANPLPFYDQAQPLLVSIYFKLSADLFAYESVPLRYSLLVLTALMIAPAFYMLRRYEWGAFVFLLALIANAYSVGLYFTEIKHYFFEIAGSFMAVYAIWQVEHRREPYWAIATAALVSLVGFSTLLLSGGLVLYALGWMLANQNMRISRSQMLGMALVSLVMLTAYLHMKHMTLFQINNYPVYRHGGPIQAIRALIDATRGAYGKSLIVCAIASLALWFHRPRGFAFRLNLFLCLLAGLVLAGRLSGHYPVVYARHVVWLVPISLVVTTLAILGFISGPSRRFRLLGWLMLGLLAAQAGWVTHRYAVQQSVDITENNRLYEHLAQLEPTHVLVYPHAEASLEYYRKRVPELARHQYLGLREFRSEMRDASTADLDFDTSLVQLFDERPTTDFDLLISHLDVDSPDEIPHRRTLALEAGMRKAGCSAETLLTGKAVRLLQLHCPAPAM